MAQKQNWSQVRHRTDTGQTDDKVDFPDPATVPLGTDEEAGGASTPEEDIARSERSQHGSASERRSHEAANPVHEGQRSGNSRQLILAVLLIVAVLIVLFAAL